MSGCILNDDRVVSLFERGFPKGVPDLYRRERYLDATSRESGCATNGVSTLRGDEESACAHKLLYFVLSRHPKMALDQFLLLLSLDYWLTHLRAKQ
jgi:hypothetical protein